MIDFANGPVDAPQLPVVISDKGTYTDISVCPEEGVLFASTKDDPNPGTLTIYKTAKRVPEALLSATSIELPSGIIMTKPELVHTIEVGAGPDHTLPNSDCSILAVANEGEGDYDDVAGLINPEGSVTLVKGPFLDVEVAPITTTVTFPWTDDELLAKGINLPLSEKALEYWDDHSAVADDIDFSTARASYTAASVLEPEWLVWSADEKYVLVNLQENSALVKINVADEVAEDIYRYVSFAGIYHGIVVPLSSVSYFPRCVLFWLGLSRSFLAMASRVGRPHPSILSRIVAVTQCQPYRACTLSVHPTQLRPLLLAMTLTSLPPTKATTLGMATSRKSSRRGKSLTT